MLDFSEDGMKCRPITLQEILDNDKDIPVDDRLSIRTRNNIVLYLKAFHLDAGVLDRRYGFGVDAVQSIQNSSTYQGFVCAVEGKKYRDNPAADVNSLDYKIGYGAGIKASQSRRRRA